MTIRRRWLLRCGIFTCVVGGLLAWISWRALARRAAIDAILNFDATVYAQYGEYEYSPPLKIPPSRGLVIHPTVQPTAETQDSGAEEVSADSSESSSSEWPGVVPPEEDGAEPYENTLTLIIGGGMRVLGYIVIDEPPPFLAWATPLFGEEVGAHVTEIEIFDERFSDKDVDLLLALPDLKALDLCETSITDEGLTKLAVSLDHLVKLDVYDTEITDRSIRLLSNCKQLRQLDLRETECSEDVAEDLQEALPDCLIFR